jgi:poly-gamma-glutamate biosynthesis protein PgsC/CapC
MSFIEIFLIGLVAGFIFHELTGVSAGGVVAPAYFAISIHEPARLVVTAAIALAVYGTIRFLSSRLVLYGRRKLLLALLVGFALKLVLERGIQPLPWADLELQSIGFIIPGLVGNEMHRQGIAPTLLGLAIVTVFVRLITLLA